MIDFVFNTLLLNYHSSVEQESLFSKCRSSFELCIAVRGLKEYGDHHGTLKDFDQRFQTAGAVDDQKRFECVHKQSQDIPESTSRISKSGFGFTLGQKSWSFVQTEQRVCKTHFGERTNTQRVDKKVIKFLHFTTLFFHPSATVFAWPLRSVDPLIGSGDASIECPEWVGFNESLPDLVRLEHCVLRATLSASLYKLQTEEATLDPLQGTPIFNEKLPSIGRKFDSYDRVQFLESIIASHQ